MKKIAIILIYISLFICTLRGQKIFYVNHPIISNSNYNYHNLQELHNKLIQEYGSTVNEDITIEVYDDWYPESTLLWKINGTPDHKVTVIGDKNGQGSRPIFYGSSIDTVSQPYGAPALIINAEYVTISNIHFKSFYGATHYKPGHKKYNKCQHRVALTINGNYNSIKECKFSDFTGIGPEAAISIPIDRKYNRVAQCDFANLNGHIFLHAVYINGGDSNLVINNYVEDCSGGPFKVKNMAINNKFIDNEINKCKAAGYFISQDDNLNNIVKGTITHGPDPDSSYYGGFIKSINNIQKDPDSWVCHEDSNTWRYIRHKISEDQDLVIGSSPAMIDIGFPLQNAHLKYDNSDWYRWGFIDENKNGRIDGQESIKISFENAPANLAFQKRTDTLITKCIFEDKGNSKKPRVIGPWGLYSRFVNDKQEFLIQNKDSYYLEKWVMEEGEKGVNNFDIIGADIKIYFIVRDCDDYIMSLKNTSDSLLAYSNSGTFISKLNNDEKYTVTINNRTDSSFTFIAEPIYAETR